MPLLLKRRISSGRLAKASIGAFLAGLIALQTATWSFSRDELVGSALLFSARRVSDPPSGSTFSCLSLGESVRGELTADQVAQWLQVLDKNDIQPMIPADPEDECPDLGLLSKTDAVVVASVVFHLDRPGRDAWLQEVQLWNLFGTWKLKSVGFGG